MKKQIAESQIGFNSEQLFDMVVIGEPIPINELDIKLKFNYPLKENIDLIVTFDVTESTPLVMPIRLKKGYKGGNIMTINAVLEKCRAIRFEAAVNYPVTMNIKISQV